MKKFLKLKMAADPILCEDLELGLHEESSEVFDKTGYQTKTQNKKSQQTIEKPFSDSKLYLENQNENLVKLDHQKGVDPEKQKILNTIFHYKNKKPVAESHLIKNIYHNDNDDSDNEKVFLPKSILKKEPKPKTEGKKNNVHFGYEEFFWFDKSSSIIPKPKKPARKTPKKNSKRKGNRKIKRGNQKPKKNVKVLSDKEIKKDQDDYIENSEGNEELTIAEQILLVKPTKNERENTVVNNEENGEDFSDVEKAESISCFKRKSPQISEDQQTKTFKILMEKEKQFSPDNHNGHEKLSTEILATLCVFENCDTTQDKPFADQQKEIERATNLTPLDFNLIKQPFVEQWMLNVKQFYPPK